MGTIPRLHRRLLLLAPLLVTAGAFGVGQARADVGLPSVAAAPALSTAVPTLAVVVPTAVEVADEAVPAPATALTTTPSMPAETDVTPIVTPVRTHVAAVATAVPKRVARAAVTTLESAHRIVSTAVRTTAETTVAATRVASTETGTAKVSQAVSRSVRTVVSARPSSPATALVAVPATAPTRVAAARSHVSVPARPAVSAIQRLADSVHATSAAVRHLARPVGALRPRDAAETAAPAPVTLPRPIFPPLAPATGGGNAPAAAGGFSSLFASLGALIWLRADAVTARRATSLFRLPTSHLSPLELERPG